MPRLRRTVPRLGKKTVNGRTYAVVHLAGKMHYCGTWNTKAARAEYDRLIAEWLTAGRPSKPEPAGGEVEVSVLCAQFWKHAKGYYNETTLDHFKRVIKTLRAKYGHTMTADFSPLALKSLRQEMVDSGAGRNYANQFMRQVRFVFKWGTSEDLVPVEVYQKLATVAGLRAGKTEAPESSPVLPVSVEHFEATLNYLPQVVADLLRVQFYSGARPGEVRELTPGDINREVDPWEARLTRHKTAHHGRPRVLFFGPKAQAVLAPYLLRPADAFCFCPADSERKRLEALHDARTTPLSCGNVPGSNRKVRPKRKPGRAYGKDSLNRAVARAVEKLNAERAKQGEDPVPSWSPNQLRHTAATLLRAEFDLETARTVLGHSKSVVTEIYAEKDLQSARSAVARFG